jgi:hypothetical protein
MPPTKLAPNPAIITTKSAIKPQSLRAIAAELIALAYAATARLHTRNLSTSQLSTRNRQSLPSAPPPTAQYLRTTNRATNQPLDQAAKLRAICNPSKSNSHNHHLPGDLS